MAEELLGRKGRERERNMAGEWGREGREVGLDLLKFIGFDSIDYIFIPIILLRKFAFGPQSHSLQPPITWIILSSHSYLPQPHKTVTTLI